ncbi:MAG: DUF1648 domain-containing protein [Eggerthellaceae bacterium]|nr:DUF1648 domain-containing protein [Eggerthellaceae bacterium]
MVPLTGGLLAATPWLMRRNECFAVTVPAGKQKDPRLLALKRNYTKAVVIVTAICTVAAAIPLVDLAKGRPLNEALFTWLLILALLVPIASSFALMLRARRKVQAVKAEEGWTAARQQVAAIVVEEDAPQPVSLAWNLLYVPIMTGVAGLALALYPSMPDVLPMHMNFMGEVDSVVEKGPGAILFALGAVLLLIACMVFSHWSITRSKRPTDPGSPVTSAFAYGMFARAQSIFLLIAGMLLSALLGFGQVLAFAGIVTLGQMTPLIVAVALLVVVGAVIMSVVYGQAGSRLHARMQGADADAPLVFDDDEHWILGIFYYNKDDAALFLPERFGIGWTINLARPAAWGIIAGLIVIIVAFLAVSFALTAA